MRESHEEYWKAVAYGLKVALEITLDTLRPVYAENYQLHLENEKLRMDMNKMLDQQVSDES